MIPSLLFQRHGIGVDLVSVKRCQALCQRQGPAAWARLGVLTPPDDPESERLFAKRWACCEAIWKATRQCGWHLNLTEIDIQHDEAGRPWWRLRPCEGTLPRTELWLREEYVSVEAHFSSETLGGSVARLIPATEPERVVVMRSSLSLSDEEDVVIAICSCVIELDEQTAQVELR